MASSLALETWSADDNIKFHEYFQGLDVELLEIDTAVLMSLLEDPLADDQEHDRLNDVIRSLEAEIHQGTTDGDYLRTHTRVIGDGDENQRIDNTGRPRSCDRSDSSGDFSSTDMDTVTSFSGEGLSWYMEELGDGMNCEAELGCIGDCYYCPQVYSMEEATYESLWQETSDGKMMG